MTIETALFTRLSGYAGLSALVSARIYPKRAPQNATLPCLVYERVSATRVPALNSDTDIVEARFQITVVASTYSSILSVSTQVRSALQRYRGTVSGIVIDDIQIVNDTDIYDPAVEFYQRAIDFEITHRE